jgi:hypothetical protein
MTPEEELKEKVCVMHQNNQSRIKNRDSHPSKSYLKFGLYNWYLSSKKNYCACAVGQHAVRDWGLFTDSFEVHSTHSTRRKLKPNSHFIVKINMIRLWS